MKKCQIIMLVITFFITLLNDAYAQKKYTIYGTIKAKRSGEVLIGASAYLPELPQASVLSNAYGFYSITAPAGNYTMIVSYSGYRQDSLKISLNKDLLKNIDLIQINTELQTIVINPKRQDANITSPLMGMQQLSVTDIKDIPVLFGEKDILKTLQLLPGVQSAGDGNSGFYVRGGSTDQNLILLDEATVYNPSHFFGFFSVFNSDAIKDVTLYKGAIPAEFGGRLASVLDVRMNDGNAKEFQASGGIGLISSRLNLEGPIGKKEKGPFIVSARRTYADLFLKLSKDSTINQNTIYFYDLNAKANYSLGVKDHIYLSGYFGKDVLGLGNIYGTNYSNATGTFRWNHILTDKLFSNMALLYSKYNYVENINSGESNIDLTSYIRDFHLKEDLAYYAGPGSKIKFGIDLIDHATSPGVIKTTDSTNFNPISLQNKHALENTAYISHEFSLSEKIHIDYGLRATLFSLIGPGTFYSYDTLGNVIDSAKYAAGKTVKSYFNLEPRFSVSYKLSTSGSLKFAYTRTTQNLHLLSNTTSANPTDVWIPSSNNVKPETADQLSFGYYRNFKNNQYEFSSEVYYRDMQNQIDYKNGAQLNANENVESQLIFGKGRAYGLELFLKKKTGRLTGWISYTLSRTERKFDGVNNDSWYPASQDRPNDISIVGIYKISNKLTFSSDFVYYTGNAVTWPSGKYDVYGQVNFIYTERNGYRMPSYNRLDVGLTVQGKKTKKFDSNWNFSVYNLYGRENPYSISFQQDPDNPAKTQAIQYSLFRWVPSITYNFNFK